MTIFSGAVAASADDAGERGNNTLFDSTNLLDTVRSNATASTQNHLAGRIPNVTIPAGATINTCEITVFAHATTQDDPNLDAHFEAVDDAPDFSTNPDVADRALTAESVAWVATGIGTGLKTLTGLAAALQEVVNRPGWASGQAVVVVLRARGDFDSRLQIRMQDNGTGDGLSLSADYTAAGGGETHEDALALAREMGQASVNTIDMQPALSLARSGDISFAGGLSSDQTVTLARSGDMAFVATVTLDQAINLSRTSGIDLSATLTLEEALSLARAAGMNLSGVLVIEESLSLARSGDMAVSGGLVLASDLTLARLAGLSSASDMSKEVALSLARAGGMSQAAQLDAVGNLTLARLASISAGSQAELIAALNLARAGGLGLAGNLTLEEALLLARSATAVFASDLVSGGEVVGSVVGLADSALYIVSLSDSALYVVSLSDELL